jgi:hypothetical protein
VVDKVALGQVFSEYFGFPCQFSFHQLFHNHHISSGAGTIGQQWPTYQVDSASPHPEKLKKNSHILATAEGSLGFPPHPSNNPLVEIQLLPRSHYCHDLTVATMLYRSQCLSFRGSNGEVSWLELDSVHVFKGFGMFVERFMWWDEMWERYLLVLLITPL